jgi:hypothetical protein
LYELKHTKLCPASSFHSGDHQFEIPSNGSDILHFPDAGKKNWSAVGENVRDLESLGLLRKEFLPK